VVFAVNAVDAAEHEILVNAYGLTTGSGIVEALAQAGQHPAGLQLGLGLSLAALGIRLIETQIWLGVAISALMLGLTRYQRSPVALVAVLDGIGIGQVLGIAPPFPIPDVGLHLPHLVMPTWRRSSMAPKMPWYHRFH